MSILRGATNVMIQGGEFRSYVTNNTIEPQTDALSLLLSYSATAALLDAAERFDAPKCDEGTRVSMQHSMKRFVQDGDHSSIYWLHGPAGVGKSALCQSLAVSLQDEGDHAASFFFSRTAAGRNDGNQLIATLAYQLAVNFNPVQPYILDAVKKNPALLNATNATKMRKLIVDPLNNWQQSYPQQTRSNAFEGLGERVQELSNRGSKKLHPRLILVDGLDECTNPEIQRDILRCFGHAVQQLALPIRFVVACRPEPHILATIQHDHTFRALHGVNLVTMNLGDDEDADEEITTFLLKEFAEIRRTHPIRDYLPHQWPLSSQIERLVSKSSRGFIYPATVIGYIKMPNNRPDECLERILGLSRIPAGDKPYEPLDALYRYILESVPDKNKVDIHHIFHLLVLPSGRLDIEITPETIEEFFDFHPGHVQHVLGDLLCIVALHGHDEPITVLHASLPDFLLDRSRSGPLCIEKGVAHAALASFALSGRLDPDSDALALRISKHLERATLVPSSPFYRKLVNMDSDFGSLIQPGSLDKTMVGVRGRLYMPQIDFVAAYLVLLMLKDVQHSDIQRLIAQIKTEFLSKFALAEFLHSTGTDLLAAMIPRFRTLATWGTYSQFYRKLEHLFKQEVLEPQHQIHGEILGLYLLLVLGIFDVLPDGRRTECPPPTDNQSSTPQLSMCSSYLVCTVLEVLIYQTGNAYNENLEVLMEFIPHLLDVLMLHLGYSVPVITLLGQFASPPIIGRNMPTMFRPLAQIVTNYLERVQTENPENLDPDEWDELLLVKDGWTRCLLHKGDEWGDIWGVD